MPRKPHSCLDQRLAEQASSPAVELEGADETEAAHPSRSTRGSLLDSIVLSYVLCIQGREGNGAEDKGGEGRKTMTRQVVRTEREKKEGRVGNLSLFIWEEMGDGRWEHGKALGMDVLLCIAGVTPSHPIHHGATEQLLSG